MMQIPVVSLFSGSGGLDLGFENAGFEVLVAYDVFEPAVETYNSNRKQKVAKVADIVYLSGSDIAQDIAAQHGTKIPIGVIGGPPCQAFSRSNVYPREDDLRRTLPGHFARLLRELSDHYDIAFFVFENVQGLTFERHKQEFARFRFLFEEAGFRLFEKLLNAKDYGVPQDRPRVFIVGINKKFQTLASDIFVFPKPIKREITVKQAFHAAFGDGSGQWPEPAFFRRGISEEEIPFHPNHWTLMPKSEKFRNGLLREGEIRGRSFRVLAWDKPSWTVAYGNREIHIHPTGKRRLSIFEAMVLQGFPRQYVLRGTLSAQVKLISDAVPPPLAYHLAMSVRTWLERNGILNVEHFEGDPIHT